MEYVFEIITFYINKQVPAQQRATEIRPLRESFSLKKISANTPVRATLPPVIIGYSILARRFFAPR